MEPLPAPHVPLFGFKFRTITFMRFYRFCWVILQRFPRIVRLVEPGHLCQAPARKVGDKNSDAPDKGDTIAFLGKAKRNTRISRCFLRVRHSKTKLDHQKPCDFIVRAKESFISRMQNTQAAWTKVLSPDVSCASQASHAAVIHVVIQHDHLTGIWLRLQQGAHISCNPWISK